jgi:two-component system phosphate regulon sensor histidine kinase PhoR
MGTFELISTEDESVVPQQAGQERLGSVVLLNNARWFTQVRWIVVIVFVLLGLMGTFLPGFFKRNGFVAPSPWPFVLAGALVVANVPLSIWVRRIREAPPSHEVELNIWIQIIIDLLVVTGLVYKVGSTDTFISFAYLFHIALACIFFPPRLSLLVTFLAMVMYTVTVALEITGVLPASGILINNQLISRDNTALRFIFSGSSVFVWLVVWYFVSTLSSAVRKRDEQLRTANERLVRADEEKTQQVLVTTHELKAPFTGIESNIQLLKFQHWNDIPESVRTLIERIDARAHTLRERIGQILILGDLKLKPTLEEQSEAVDLRKLIGNVVEELKEKAEERHIVLNIDIPPVSVQGTAQGLGILFSNLISNAINYSHENGVVEVALSRTKDRVIVTVTDHGIGIREDAIPHIFDEYFRTKEASKFNKRSTGLGLTMVKEIARNLGLGIKVTSEEGKGTTFEVILRKK